MWRADHEPWQTCWPILIHHTLRYLPWGLSLNDKIRVTVLALSGLTLVLFCYQSEVGDDDF